MTWGAPIVNNAVQRYGIRQSECLELHKMWVSDTPPRNAESRALSVAVRMIGKRYPKLRLLLTYCDGEESAVAYRASGWIPQGSNRYLREIRLSSGRVMSVRDVNRKGGKSVLPAGCEQIYVDRKKLVYVLDESLASVVQSSMPVVQTGDGGSRPTRTLHTPPARLDDARDGRP